MKGDTKCRKCMGG